MEFKKPKLNEQQIIQGCIRGESWAQKRIYEQYASIMMGVCVRYVADRETAKDILQDGFIKVFSKVNSYSELGSFEGWMRKVFVTTSLEYLRKKDVLKQSQDIDFYNEIIENEDVSVLSKITADDLLVCISELADGYRTVFNLFVMEGYTHAEIGNLLGISENTSRSQFMRARVLLQKKVQSLFNY